MLSRTSLAALAALTAALSLAPALAFDATANSNLAVYWGQGPNQLPLAHFCQQSAIDVIPLAFLNVFPDQGAGGYPGTNFGNACGSGTFTTPKNVTSQLLNNCPNLQADIAACQSMGKKILLSLGGAVPDTSKINSNASATTFADFLWGAFGPVTSNWTGPRPFGDVVLDGFDFDPEHNGNTGYATLAMRLRELYQTNPTKPYYLSAAPQCVLPDAQLADAVEQGSFDFIWVQFFNTPGCSGRDYISGTNHFTFDDWVVAVRASANPNAKLFIGLPADTSAVYTPAFYLNPSEVTKIAHDFRAKYPREFGGLMLWEATASEKNQDGGKGKNYAAVCKEILLQSGSASATNRTSVSTSTGTSISASTRTSVSTSTGTSVSTSTGTTGTSSSTSASTRTSASTSTGITTSTGTSTSASTRTSVSTSTGTSITASTGTSTSASTRTSVSTSTGTSITASTGTSTSASTRTSVSTSTGTCVTASTGTSTSASTRTSVSTSTGTSITASSSSSTGASTRTSVSTSTGTSVSAYPGTSATTSAGTSISPSAGSSTSLTTPTGAITSSCTGSNANPATSGSPHNPGQCCGISSCGTVAR
ncbi:MAG: hypothetical protein M1826_005130 [Phylliscum demangeonii]|nr:MAG: hypothetical protein M1826_005130 [Phylliscum demangeonii]